MGKSVNQVILLGRLTRDVEVRSTANGKNVASFTLAVDRNTDGADFFDVTAWEKLAEVFEKWTRKGSKVLVTGRLQQRTWEQDGQKRSKVDVVATDVTLMDSKSESEPAAKKDTIAPVGDEPIDLASIPF